MKGNRAAGVATMRAAGVEVAQNFLAKTQSALLPLVLYDCRGGAAEDSAPGSTETITTKARPR